MPAARPPSPLRWLRRALLIAMLVVLAAVGALFYLGRTLRPRVAAPAAPASIEPPAAAPTPRDTVVVTEGFEYEQQVEGKPVFRIRGDRMTTDRGGRVELEGVGLELYRAGEPFTMSSRRAVYDRATGNAQLEGEVHLAGSRLWEVDADRLDLIDGGKTVVSRRGGERVRFRRAEMISGSAGALRFTLDDEKLVLSDQVKARAREEDEGRRMTIDAERLIWQRDDRTVDAVGGVELGWGRSRLGADELQATLLADESGLESARATGKVTGTLLPEKGNRIELAGERCDVTIDAADGAPSRVVLGGGAGTPAQVEWKHERALRTLVAPEVDLSLSGGVPTVAHATGGVRLEEAVRGAPKRTMRGGRLDARFDAAGELDSAELEGDVEIDEGPNHATGDSARIAGGGERAVLTGKPARSRGPRGEVEAPRLAFERSAGRVDAEGGVRARFEPETSPLPSAESAATREPIRVEAKQGTFLERSRGFVFEGNVQAIQGSSLLFADRLEGDETSGTTTATGKVRTIWNDVPEAESDAGPDAKRGAGRPRGRAAPASAQTVATAESLVYRRDEGELRYAGDVLVRQEPREIRASEVTVKLSEDRRAERMHAKGAVVISDGATGRTVSGDEADYDLEAESAIVTGATVAIKDREGTVLKGKRALFDLVTGDAKLLSGEP